MRHVRLDLIILTSRVYKLLKRSQPNMRGISHNLAGACAIGANLLTEQLGNLGLSPTLVEGSSGVWGHCWVEVAGYICDPTFEQFDMGSPYLVEPIHFATLIYPECYDNWRNRTEDPDLDFQWDHSVAPCGKNGQLIVERLKQQGSRSQKFLYETQSSTL